MLLMTKKLVNKNIKLCSIIILIESTFYEVRDKYLYYEFNCLQEYSKQIQPNEKKSYFFKNRNINLEQNWHSFRTISFFGRLII